ncbi:MAG: CRISPR-associated endonuclease Cas3'', partial [Candidatus Desantisbacteria bacterium]
MYFAHSVEGSPIDEWQYLDEHLKATAELASIFSSEFGCGEWAYLAGLWHDLGKYSQKFQNMILASTDANIETKHGRVDHSTAG